MLLNCGVGEDSRESLDNKEIKSINPKGNQSWVFIGRADAEAPILWPPAAKNWLTGEDLDAGKDWRQEEKGMIEDEMGWSHPQLEGHEFEQALGVGDEQGSLVCCSPRGRKESDMTERLNWTESYMGSVSHEDPSGPGEVFGYSTLPSLLFQWVASSSVVPFPSCLQSFQASQSFPWVSSSHQVAEVLEF